MYRIAICDDNQFICTAIENYLLRYGVNKNITIDTEVFFCGETLCDYLQKEETFDIIFLDIELGSMTGIDVGHILREEINDEMTQVIFISSKENYAIQLFKIRPFDFLLKPISYKNIEAVFDTYRKIYNDKKIYFEYCAGKKIYKIAEDKIIYFRCNAKKIEIITTSGKYEYYGKMGDVNKQLDSHKFWVIHKSYIVNIEFVTEYRATELVLTIGIALPISQANRNNIKEKVMNIQIERRGELFCI